MRKTSLLILTGALALAACGKKPEEASPTNNLVEPPVENVVVEEPDAPTPAPENNVAEAKPAAPPSVSEQQQMQDDAAATGMTSRLDSGESGQGADETGNSAQ
jgi:hypothetical protein